AVEFLRWQLRRVEDVRTLHEFPRGVENVAARLGIGRAVLRGVAFVEHLAQFVALLVILGTERRVPQQVFRRLAVTERYRAVLGAEETGLLRLEAAAAGLDPHVSRELLRGQPHQLCDRRAEVRIVNAPTLRIPALDAR